VRGLEIVPFADEHVDAAARLLEERHERHRAAEPLLPVIDEFRPHVEAARGGGVAALQDGELVGYLLGEPRDDATFGRHVWVERGAQAARDRQMLRDLFAAAAEAWVEAGHRRHYVLVPALDDLAAVWFALGFGQQQTHAIRASGGTEPSGADDLMVRRGGPEDLDRMEPLAMLIWEHQARSPVFAGVAPPPPETVRADWEEALTDPDVAYFLAERDGRAVGHLLSYPGRPGLGTPPGSLDVAVVATLPDERRTGVGAALVDHALEWARAEDLDTVVLDWRTTNLLSSRFFPRRGFRPTFLRLYRSIP
jgi:ribosomal protein S18 acetylase RimI-like enzyme